MSEQRIKDKTSTIPQGEKGNLQWLNKTQLLESRRCNSHFKNKVLKTLFAIKLFSVGFLWYEKMFQKFEVFYFLGMGKGIFYCTHTIVRLNL